MNKIILLVLCIVTFNNTNAQNFEWVKTMEGSDRITSIVTDTNGNIFTTGHFSGTVDFDPGVGIVSLTSLGQADMFITKLNDLGDLQWVKHIGGTEWEEGSSITLDNAGNIYITGGFQGMVDFNPSVGTLDTLFLTATGISLDIFALKLNSSGNFIWAKQFDGANTDFGHGIAVDYEGGVYITGRFVASVDFDPSPIGTFILNSSGYDDAFVVKLNSFGNFNWATKIGGINYDSGESIAVDHLGNVFTTGIFNGTVDFDPGSGVYNLTTSPTSTDAFVQKLDKNGNFIWARHFEGTVPSYATDVKVDNLGNVFCVGRIQSATDFNPSLAVVDTFFLPSAGGYICKLNTFGEFVWAKHFAGECKIYAIDLDESVNIYTTGDFNQTVDFDPGIGTYNFSGYDSDIFISKLDSSGGFVWAAQMDGNQTYEVGLTISINNQNVYSAGVFTGTIDFNPSPSATYLLTSIGNADAYIHKLNQCQIDTSVTQNGNTLSSNATGATYQWLDCNNSYAIISGETNQSFTAIQNGSYAVEVTQNNCIDTSACISITSIGIEEDLFTNSFKCYPNPTKNNFKIAFNELQDKIIIRLVSVSGQLITEKTFFHTQIIELNMDNNTGFYFLEIINENDFKTTLKLIKE